MNQDIEHNFEFYRLLDAVLNEPEKVSAIVQDSPSILEEKNLSGETVLHWLAIENHVKGIRLLRKLGASIPEFALIHAAELGHTEAVILLLELGGAPKGWDICEIIKNPLYNLSKKTQRLIRSYLSQYGH